MELPSRGGTRRIDRTADRVSVFGLVIRAVAPYPRSADTGFRCSDCGCAAPPLPEKWRKWVVAGVQKLFASGTRRLLRFMERWSSALKKKTVIHGGTQVIFHQANGSAKAKTHKRHPRWKHLQSERARMRYLYRHMITERIRHGAHIRPTDTPAEIEHAGENSEADRVVFELYNRYRYDERKEIDKSMVESIKDTHFKDLK